MDPDPDPNWAKSWILIQIQCFWYRHLCSLLVIHIQVRVLPPMLDMPPAPTLIHVPGESVLANLPTDIPRYRTVHTRPTRYRYRTVYIASLPNHCWERINSHGDNQMRSCTLKTLRFTIRTIFCKLFALPLIRFSANFSLYHS